MEEVFMRLLTLKDSRFSLGEISVAMNGCQATLVTPLSSTDKAKVVVLNTPGAVGSALEDGLLIARMGISFEGEIQANLVLASNLSATSVKLPKAQKGEDQESTFLLKADTLSFVVSGIEALGS